MYEITEATLKKAYKPFDIVTNFNNSSVGFIIEVDLNSCQPGFESQVSYSVNWLTGKETKIAWWSHDDLTAHTNLFIEISECVCHPMSGNAGKVRKLFQVFGG